MSLVEVLRVDDSLAQLVPAPVAAAAIARLIDPVFDKAVRVRVRISLVAGPVVAGVEPEDVALVG
jgi:hypothetical protein